MGGSEKDKLRIRLNHWIGHNKEHGQEFREWADKAKGFGETEAYEEMRQAAQEMDKSSESLLKALRRLEGKKK